MTYFKTGDQERDGSFRKTYYYMNIRGSQSSVIKYVQELAGNFPAINIFKISLYPTNSQTISGGNITARIELIFYSPLSS